MTTQHDINQAQYRHKSTAYLHSAAHSQGIEFAKMRALAKEYNFQKVLDLGCGGGHVSYQLSPYVGEIVAYDLLPEMVDLVCNEALSQGLANITGQVGKAEALPFDDGQFDAVFSRYSAHHWQSVPEALAEVYRVLAVGGRFILVDILGHDNPLLDTLFQTIEVIRDPSHVRNYSPSQWLMMAQKAGFVMETLQVQSLTLDFHSWVVRMQTPESHVQTLTALLSQASDDFKRHYLVKCHEVKLGNHTNVVIDNFTSEVGYLVLVKGM